MPESRSPIHLQACYIGSRIDTREMEKRDAVLLAPLVLRAGNRGHAVVFRFGVVVFIDMTEVERQQLIERLRSRITNPVTLPSSEELDATLGEDDKLDSEGCLILCDASPERLQVVASVLAKSAVLGHYELALNQVFDRIESLAEKFRAGSYRVGDRELLREIGDVLLAQSKMVGRVEATEKPEITWDNPAFDRLYERLAIEYELRDRDKALTRKLEVVSDTAHTHLELLYNRRTLRVEWYIVILIVFEIGLTLFEKLG
ncbi:MAG TPA: RMD1 family protein [Gammaproteobacteria bacterium]